MSQTLTWTPTGIPESLTDSSDVTEFYYTADDQRILRVDPHGTLNITLSDHYESEITSTSTTDTNHYWFAGERIGMNTDDGTTEDLYFVFTDRLGTTSVFYNHTSGGTITRQWFDPWGSPRASTGTPPTEVGHTGQHTDPTGLMHYGARLYDPVYATFITPDTIVPNPANPQDLNRYAYVRNNPTTNTDPSGNQPYVPDAGAACTYVGCGGTPKSHFGSWHRFNDYQSKHSANFRAGFADFLADKVNIGLSFPIMGPIAFLNPFELLSVSAPYPEVGGFDAGYTGGVILEAVLIGSFFRSQQSAIKWNSNQATNAIDDVVRSADELLVPGGTRIGTAGSRASIREVTGGLDDAQALFTDLSRGGTVVADTTYQGLVRLPDGGTVGLRTTMTNSPGSVANIDVNIPGIDITKIKFNP